MPYICLIVMYLLLLDVCWHVLFGLSLFESESGEFRTAGTPTHALVSAVVKYHFYCCLFSCRFGGDSRLQRVEVRLFYCYLTSLLSFVFDIFSHLCKLICKTRYLVSAGSCDLVL